MNTIWTVEIDGDYYSKSEINWRNYSSGDSQVRACVMPDTFCVMSAGELDVIGFEGDSLINDGDDFRIIDGQEFSRTYQLTSNNIQ